MNAQFKAYAPTGILGYGYNSDSLATALAMGVDVIAVDAGSTDPGPNYLGTGKSFTDSSLVSRDLMPLITAAVQRKIPLIVGTSGGSGGEPHLTETRRIVDDIARKLKLSLRLAVIHSEQSIESVVRHRRNNRLKPLWPVGDISEEDIRRSERIVGLMGVEPFMKALDANADVILAGRADDAAISASYLMRRGVPEAQAWLAGRTIECGAACAEPRHGFGFDGLLATCSGDELILEPLDPRLACTRHSVAAFLLHENDSPLRRREPTGILDLSKLSIEPLDERRVVLKGATFEPASRSIRLEGVEFVGFRTLTVAWTRDPVLIHSEIDSYLERARDKVARDVSDAGIANEKDYQLLFRLVGKDAVMSSREPCPTVEGHELGILVDTVARTAEASAAIGAAARQAIKNAPYPGKLCDEGCITFPYSPSDIPLGPVYRYHLWHVVEDPDFEEMFPIDYYDYVRGDVQ